MLIMSIELPKFRRLYFFEKILVLGERIFDLMSLGKYMSA